MREKRRISTPQFLRQVPALLRFILCISNSLATTTPREYSAQCDLVTYSLFAGSSSWLFALLLAKLLLPENPESKE